MKGGPPRATFRDVLAVREFRVLWASVILSTAGDRLALVALTLLVYGRTHSPLLAALVYAAGYLPWVIGGLFLADVADRRPRRSVMVFCDAARAVLVAAMLIPHVPVTGLVALLFVATMFAPPFDSAKASITPDILQGERYVLGTAILQTTLLAAQVAGAVGGGVGVHFIGVRRSLAIDAATFVLSGVLIALGTRARPARGQAGNRPALAPGPDAGRIPAGLRRPGAAHAVAARLARGLLHDSRGNRGSVCGKARGRFDRRRIWSSRRRRCPRRSLSRCSRGSSGHASGPA